MNIKNVYAIVLRILVTRREMVVSAKLSNRLSAFGWWVVEINISPVSGANEYANFVSYISPSLITWEVDILGKVG